MMDAMIKRRKLTVSAIRSTRSLLNNRPTGLRIKKSAASSGSRTMKAKSKMVAKFAAKKQWAQ